jgi:hypothetical protein
MRCGRGGPGGVIVAGCAHAIRTTPARAGRRSLSGEVP